MTGAESTASFGYWVRRQRLALDLTQAELARQVGCATVTISKIEQDERRPSHQMAVLLAARLSIPDDQRQTFLAAAAGDHATDRMPLATQPSHATHPPANSRERSSLPAPLAPFVGRERELQQLTQCLADRACRLLTLVGPGGFGKTRLAIRLGELASAHEDLFPDGACFVALDGVGHADRVVSAVASSLQITFYEQRDQVDQLIRYLAGKQMLLIFDNAEGILDAALVEQILKRAPNVKIVVTTREALGLAHEWFFPVLGLNLSEGRAGEAAVVATDDAVQLFLQSAQRARPDFDLGRELRHAVQICRAVDGVPLAIELAAAWLRSLPCAQIAHEVEHNLDMLTSPLRNASERHRSMRFVLERSWEYLADEEQRVFRQLAVFAGKFQPDAAQAVVGARLPTLAALVDKAVVQLAQDGRYQIHALLRRLVGEKLAHDAQELAAVQARHSDYYMTFLSARHLSISGPDQVTVLSEIEDEFDNLQLAAIHAARTGQLEARQAALDCIFRFLWTRGLYAEGRTLATQLLEAEQHVTHCGDSSIRPLLTLYQARFAAATGAYDQARAVLESVRGTIQLAGTPGDRAFYHAVAGMIAEHLGESERAFEHHGSAYDIYRAQGDGRNTASTALQLGYAAYTFRGELRTCQQLAEESLRLYRAMGDPSGMAEALDLGAWMAVVAGGLDEAERDYEESLRLAQIAGHRLVAAKAIGGLGQIAWARGDLASATEYMLARLAGMQEIGHENQFLGSLTLLCGVYAHAERYGDAVALLTECPGLWRTPWTAQAHIGAGLFEEAMRYLPGETSSQVASANTYGLSRCLVAWAMLLLATCDLVWQPDPASAPAALAREDRRAKAAEILLCIRTNPGSDLSTRLHAAQLLTQHLAWQAPSESPTDGDPECPRSMEHLAQEMLTIRLA